MIHLLEGTTMAFKALGLSDRLVQGILATGYTAPTEIQSRAIPLAVAGKDIIGSAQTGTGKTAAFTLPILHRLSEQTEKTHHIKALILTPTRELAQQIEDAVKQYGRFLPVRALSIYGGTNMHNQLKQLSRGVDILIATPGRLIDHLERKSVNLSRVEVLVLDEADRMFDMGFIDDMRLIIKQTPETRQTLLFSATMSKEVKTLVKNIQKNPELIEVGHHRTPATTVTQHFYSVNDDKKLSLLLHILQSKDLDSVLVFSKTKVGAEKVSNNLHKNGIKSVSIHSDRTQAQRQRALAGFKQGQYRVMVATDVAARGIDVDGISHVINYDIPGFAEDYIHRIGRTGRAQSTGDALTFVTRSEARHVKKIEQFIGKKFEIKKYPDFDYHKVEEKPARHAHASEPALTTDAEPNFNREPREESPNRFKRNDRRSNQRPGTGARTERSNGFNRSDRRGGDQRNRVYGKPDSSGGGKRKPFGNTGGDRSFSKPGAFSRSRSTGNRESFNGGGRDNGFTKRPPFNGDRRESNFGRRDIFGPKKRDTFGPKKRVQQFNSQDSFSEAGGFDAPKRVGGPDWRTLIPEEREFKPREHKVVKKMVSRKKKDS